MTLRFSIADALVLFVAIGLGLLAARYERSSQDMAPPPTKVERSSVEWGLLGLSCGLTIWGPGVVLRQRVSGRRTGLTEGEWAWMLHAFVYVGGVMLGQVVTNGLLLLGMVALLQAMLSVASICLLLGRAAGLRSSPATWTDTTGSVAVLVVNGVFAADLCLHPIVI